MMEDLIFTLAFKGKQDIREVYKMKYVQAKKYRDQILEYYASMADALNSIGKNK